VDDTAAQATNHVRINSVVARGAMSQQIVPAAQMEVAVAKAARRLAGRTDFLSAAPARRRPRRSAAAMTATSTPTPNAFQDATSTPDAKAWTPTLTATVCMKSAAATAIRRSRRANRFRSVTRRAGLNAGDAGAAGLLKPLIRSRVARSSMASIDQLRRCAARRGIAMASIAACSLPLWFGVVAISPRLVIAHLGGRSCH